MNINGDKCPDPATFESRINIWTSLFLRWTQNEISGIDRENQQFYGVQNKIRRDNVLEVIEDKNSADNDIYIELDELERHFTQLVKAPLPKILYNKHQDEEPTEFSDPPRNQAKSGADEEKSEPLKPVVKEQRYDLMRAEIEIILDELPEEQKKAAFVMKKLKERVGKVGSCVISSEPDGVKWKNTPGKVNHLDMDALRGRITRSLKP